MQVTLACRPTDVTFFEHERSYILGINVYCDVSGIPKVSIPSHSFQFEANHSAEDFSLRAIIVIMEVCVTVKKEKA
jgi:hypothetical protein